MTSAHTLLFNKNGCDRSLPKWTTAEILTPVAVQTYRPTGHPAEVNMPIQPGENMRYLPTTIRPKWSMTHMHFNMEQQNPADAACVII
jgi:hypothetical protein